MKEITNIALERTVEAELGSRRAYPGLEWTESEWFKVWLELARDKNQQDQN